MEDVLIEQQKGYYDTGEDDSKSTNESDALKWDSKYEHVSLIDL